ncbi:unnamed protein product [Blepharisma stoltei]|uniref:DUF4746 domain-containing protein n=1 Tax=Blepharisma stoltei TaxID=1481888 RepID=A0AAU9JUL3_9CILI|nr:unnamed protein product [Blepharisma stoltei]
MDLAFIHNRKPISFLEVDAPRVNEKDAYNFLESKFDMYQITPYDSYQKARSFAFLEHLLRITTPKVEIVRFMSGTNSILAKKFTEILKINEGAQGEALKMLQNEISEEDLSSIPPNLNHLTTYKLQKGQLMVYEEPDNKRMRSYCYILISKKRFFILYTPIMTFVDGFDPFSGNKITPLIPPNFVACSARVLYINYNKNYDEAFPAIQRRITKEPSIKGPPKIEKIEKKPSGMSVFNADDDKILEPTASEPIFSEESFKESEIRPPQRQENEEIEEDEEFSVDDINFNTAKEESEEETETETMPEPDFKAIQWKNTERKIRSNREELCGAGSCLLF